MTCIDIISLLQRNRSVRRFRQDIPVSPEAVAGYVDATRFCASGRNLQPLKYMTVTGPALCEKIFPLLHWAGYLTDWEGPTEGERPAAYVIQLLDTELTDNPMCDDGLQLEALTLAACADGVNSCIIKSFNAVELMKTLSIPSHLAPRYIVALGHPAEEVVIERMKDSEIKYWRTPDGIHHVPKRPLSEILIPVNTTI